MADENEVDGAAPKSKKKLIIIVVALVVLLGGGGAGAFFFMGGADTSDDTASSKGAGSSAPAIEVPASYVNLPQPFLFNVTGDKRNRLVQIKVQLMVRGSKNEELARYHSPLIESTILSTFASATAEQLQEPTGRIDIRNKATSDLQATLVGVVGESVIENILFTDFVIQ